MVVTGGSLVLRWNISEFCFSVPFPVVRFWVILVTNSFRICGFFLGTHPKDIDYFVMIFTLIILHV